MRISFFLLLFSYSLTWSQQTLPNHHDSTALKREFVLHSNAQAHSNHLTSAVSQRVIFGGHIEDAEIQKSIDQLKTKGLNRSGAIFNADFVYSDYTKKLFGKKQFGYVISGGHQSFFGLTYRDAVFRLAALGNESAPEINDLTDTRFYQMSHHKIGFGILDKKTRSYFALNFIGSTGFTNFDLLNGVLRQNVDKDTTDIVLIGSLMGNNSAQFLRGIGLGLDVDLRMPVKIKEREMVIQILAQNLGFARMNKSTFTYDLDTTYSYTGFDLQQIQDLSNGGEFSLVDSLNIRKQSAGSNEWLPGFVQVAKIVNRNLDQKFQAFYGLNMFTQIIYLPQVFAGAHWQATKSFAAGIHGHLGGFGGARLGCYADLTLGQFKLGLSSQDILGTAAKIGYGHSLLFRLSWQQK